MQYPDLLDNNAREALLKKAKEEDLPKKVLNSEYVNDKVNEGLDKLTERGEGTTSAIRKFVERGIDENRTTTDSLTLVYLAVELVPVLLTMILCSIFIFSFLISWLLLVAAIIVVIIYVIVFKFQEKLENSGAGMIIAILASISEGVILASVGSSINTTVFAAELAILIVAFAVASIFARTLGSEYKKRSGRRIGLIVLGNMGLLFMIFISEEVWYLVNFT